MPFQNILVGTDFSNSSDAAVFAALAIGRKLDARVDVFHAIERPDAEARAREARDRLARIDGIDQAQLHVEASGAGELLRRLRGQLDPDLVVLGTTGQHKLRRLLLGSLSGQALHTPGCPLLTVDHAPRGGLFMRTLVALEDPDLQSPALETGLALCHRLRGELTILHVLPPRGYASDRRRVELSPDTVPARLRQVAARTDPSIPVEVEVCHGDPAVEIPRAAHKFGAELVVLGAERGPRGEPGPVAERVAAANLPASLYVWPPEGE